MTFLDMRFPTGISFGAVGGPGFSSDVVTLNSGFESRNQNWQDARCSYDVSKGCTSDEDRMDLIAFFRMCKGRVHSFRFKDWTDFEVDTGEGVMIQLTATTYQLVKRYTTDDGTDDRDIALPYEWVIKQGVNTLIDGQHYSVDDETGILTVLGSPTPFPTAWTGKFDVPCRFDTDKLQLVAEDQGYFKSQSIPIVEIRFPES